MINEIIYSLVSEFIATVIQLFRSSTYSAFIHFAAVAQLKGSNRREVSRQVDLVIKKIEIGDLFARHHPVATGDSCDSSGRVSLIIWH
ncbi:MAG: hypothetical protein DME48_03525 [Verrucomicrobia bacterium]|nr:MAG: hypothetical protein DME48_03525 [Verrucomicrobiota bacterium]